MSDDAHKQDHAADQYRQQEYLLHDKGRDTKTHRI